MQPQKVWVIIAILSSVTVKMTLNARTGFSAFLYRYIDYSAFLEVARKGGYSPLNPPLRNNAAQLSETIWTFYSEYRLFQTTGSVTLINCASTEKKYRTTQYIVE